MMILTAESYAQKNDLISSIDFVQIVGDNKKEALYYYQNNWLFLRKRAVEEGYIHSFRLLETPFSEEAPFDLMLITTYKDLKQFDKREQNFKGLIEEKGGLKLMNDMQPGDFRKIIFKKDLVRHWD